MRGEKGDKKREKKDTRFTKNGRRTMKSDFKQVFNENQRKRRKKQDGKRKRKDKTKAQAEKIRMIEREREKERIMKRNEERNLL